MHCITVTNYKNYLGSKRSKLIFILCYALYWQTERPMDTDKRVAPLISFIYWFGLQNLRRHMFFFKNGPSPASISFIFELFQTNNTIFTTIQCEQMSCPSSIRCRDSNTRPLDCESPPITTRPGLPPIPRWIHQFSFITLISIERTLIDTIGTSSFVEQHRWKKVLQCWSLEEWRCCHAEWCAVHCSRKGALKCW